MQGPFSAEESGFILEGEVLDAALSMR